MSHYVAEVYSRQIEAKGLVGGEVARPSPETSETRPTARILEPKNSLSGGTLEVPALMNRGGEAR